MMEVATALKRIRFSVNRVSGDREHYLDPEDIRILLARLPLGLWAKLRAVHFNDRSWGARTLGYVTRGHREIAICALPPRISLTRMLVDGTGSKGQKKTSPTEFGAVWGRPWSRLAVRVFLHELGHLQVVDESTNEPRKRYAKERKAQEFADYWRMKLWSASLDNLAPEHNGPDMEEVAALRRID